MVLELGPHRRVIEDVLQLLGAQTPRLAQYLPEQARAHVHVVSFPAYIEQHEGEGLLHAGQRPEGDMPERPVFFLLGNETPLRAHRVDGEHALQVVPDFFTMVGRAGNLDAQVELVGTDGTVAHLCGPPSATRSSGKGWSWVRAE